MEEKIRKRVIEELEAREEAFSRDEELLNSLRCRLLMREAETHRVPEVLLYAVPRYVGPGPCISMDEMLRRLRANRRSVAPRRLRDLVRAPRESSQVTAPGDASENTVADAWEVL